MLQDLVLVDRPGQDEVLVGAPPQRILVALVEVVDVDGELAAEMIEQRLRGVQPLFGRRARERRVRRGPLLLGRDELVERLVVDLEQARLLEVRRGDAPATLEVAVEAVADDVAQGGVAGALRGELRLGLARVELGWEGQLVGDLRGQVVVGETVTAGLGGGAVQRGAEHADLDEVVEVAGLERGVLAVVGEGQQLPRDRIEGFLVAQRADRREREQTRGGAAAAGAEGAELAEVTRLATAVFDPAREAEAERRGHVRHAQPAGAFRAVGLHVDDRWQVLAAVTPDALAAIGEVLEPGVGDAAFLGLGIVGPRIGRC